MMCQWVPLGAVNLTRVRMLGTDSHHMAASLSGEEKTSRKSVLAEEAFLEAGR